jgi:hypothetical protein
LSVGTSDFADYPARLDSDGLKKIVSTHCRLYLTHLKRPMTQKNFAGHSFRARKLSASRNQQFAHPFEGYRLAGQRFSPETFNDTKSRGLQPLRDGLLSS